MVARGPTAVWASVCVCVCVCVRAVSSTPLPTPRPARPLLGSTPSSLYTSSERSANPTPLPPFVGRLAHLAQPPPWAPQAGSTERLFLSWLGRQAGECWERGLSYTWFWNSTFRVQVGWAEGTGPCPALECWSPSVHTHTHTHTHTCTTQRLSLSSVRDGPPDHS